MRLHEEALLVAITNLPNKTYLRTFVIIFSIRLISILNVNTTVALGTANYTYYWELEMLSFKIDHVTLF